MFIYWVIIVFLLAKVFTFFETNKLKVVKRNKYLFSNLIVINKNNRK